MNNNNNDLVITKVPENYISNIEDIHFKVSNDESNISNFSISKIAEYSDVIFLSALYLLNQFI